MLSRQLRSPLLWLLLAAAAVSGVVGERLDAFIIGVIVAASVGLGFVNEYRAERAAEAMHSEIRHDVAATRDGESVNVEVTQLVPGDIVHLGVGSIVPADVRLLTASDLECDESILTGESVPAAKSRRAGADRSASGRAGVVPVHGDDRARRRRRRRRGRHRRRHPVRADRHRARRTSPPDRVPARPDPLLRAAGQGRRRAERHDLRDQRRPRAARSSTPSCSPSRLRSASPPSCCPPSSRPAWRPGRGASPRRRCSSSGSCASRTSVTSTCCSPTRPAHSPTATSASNGRSTRDGDDDSDVLTLGLVCNEAEHAGDTAVGGNPLDVALWEAPGAAACPVRRVPPGRYRAVRSRSSPRLGPRRPQRRTAPHHQRRPRTRPRQVHRRHRRGARMCSTAQFSGRQPRRRRRQPGRSRADRRRRRPTSTTCTSPDSSSSSTSPNPRQRRRSPDSPSSASPSRSSRATTHSSPRPCAAP